MMIKNSKNYKDEYTNYYFKVFGEPQLVLKSLRESIAVDVDNNEYIDLLGAIAVNTLGGAHDELADEIAKQAKNVMHTSNFFTTTSQIELAKKLLFIADFPTNSRVFLTNSGTESVECALKIIKKYANTSKKPRILALTNSFHGRTLGALSLTYKEKYRTPFAPLIPDVEFIEAGNLQSLEDAFTTRRCEEDGEIAGLFVEIIQGEAGVINLSKDYIQRARELTIQNNALLVVDEVQTGVGRTGSWFAFQDTGIQPDVITVAKGLAGGFPIGAVIANPQAAEILLPGEHGTTFGGNPLAASAALKVIEVIERDNLLENARKIYTCVVHHYEGTGRRTRGKGALMAIEVKNERSLDVAKLVLQPKSAEKERGVIVNPVNNSWIRIAPALNIELDLLEKGLIKLDEAFKECEDEQY
ncbi:MAG: aminotransferase class III-fold pyridoxal phosphate-dependent enzyme [Candidatus Ancillula sp.]|jgi:acetylornithine aminotransferase|nr:aminotransferase class III-fold pyridoxal phosphate-dependent enzyme [Candidatus Ancillula sp.]